MNGSVQPVTLARQAFTKIAGTITDGSRAVSEIAYTSEEQARGIEHIGQAIARIEAVTQKNATNARQTADAALNVSQQVQTTRQHLEELSVVIGL